MIAPFLDLAAALTLVCSGTVRVGPLGLAMPEAEGDPISVTYRIDLDARLWCSDACETTEPLEMVENMVVLRERHYPAGSQVIMISPTQGRFTDTVIEGDRVILRSGTCERAPSGFFGEIV